MINPKLQREITKAEMVLVLQQIKLYQQEIRLREKLVADLFEKYGLYMTERNRIEDALLEREHQLMLKHGLN